MDIARRWLAVFAVAVATSACGSSTTTPSTPVGPFKASGEGNAAIAIPDSVMQLQVTSVFTGPSSTFMVWIGPLSVPCPGIASSGCRLLATQTLGSSTNQMTYTAVLSTGNGGTSASDTLSIVSSDAVNWSISQVQ